MELDIKNLDQLRSIGAVEESNQAYDVIPLPSKGVFYPNKKASIKVAYLTAADENILLSPNLLESGKAFDTLLDRKIIDKDIRPNDLLPGDRDAIFIFLRSTGYGHIYPVKLTDPKTKEKFDYDIDLSAVKYKDIVEPDVNGEYSLTLPMSGSHIKYRLLTIKDLNEIDEAEEKKKKLVKFYLDETVTKRLERIIMEVDGDRDKYRISQFIAKMKIGDSAAIRKSYSKNEPGVDMFLEVEAPSGEFFRTSIPIDIKFFWPDID